MRSRIRRLTVCLATSLLLQGLLPLGAFAGPSNSEDPFQFGPENTIKTFGGESDESTQGMAVHADGSYAVLVASESYSRNLTGIIMKREWVEPSFVLVKYSDDHVLQWIKPTHIQDNNQAVSIKATSDGGYIIGSAVEDDGYVLKLDEAGVKQWSTSIGGTGRDGVKDVIESLGQGYVIVGETYSNDEDFSGLNSHKENLESSPSAFVAKLDDDGVIQWKNVLDGESTDNATGIVELSDSYMVLGITSSIENDFTNFNLHGSHNNFDIFLAKVDQDTGALLNSPIQSFGDDEREDLTSVLPVNDGGFVITGNTQSTDGQLAEGNGVNFLAKFDASGSLSWATRFGDSSTWIANNIIELSENVYAVGATDVATKENNIYKIDGTNVSTIWYIPVDAPFQFDYLWHLTLSSGQWIGVGTVSNGGSVPDELMKGWGDDVAVFHSGPMSDKETVAEAVFDPKMEFADEDHLQWVTSNFNVNSTGINDTNLTWTSNNEAVVIDPQTGAVTVHQPPRSGADVRVMLTVTGNRNGTVASHQIELTVKKQSAWQQILPQEDEEEMEVQLFETSNDGTLYILDREGIKKKGETDEAFVILPDLPEIEQEYDIASMIVDDNDVYVSREEYDNESDELNLSILKLGSDNQWTLVETGPVPHELAPVDFDKLGIFTNYRFRNTSVDQGTIYQQVTAEYRDENSGSTTIDLLLKWDGSHWINVTPASVIGISSFVVRDGIIYTIAHNDHNAPWSLIVSNGTNITYQEELSGNSGPLAEYGSVLEVGSDGSVYIMNSYAPDDAGYVWRGAWNDGNTMNWSNFDDSFRFGYPYQMGVSEKHLFVLDSRDEVAFIMARSLVDEDAGGGDDSPVPAPGFTVTSSDPSGAENDGKTQIVIAEQVPTGHSLMYRNFGSGNVTVPMVGDEPVGYTQLPGSGLIIANNGDHIGIAMIDDTTGKIVQFGQTVAVVTAESNTPGTGTEAPGFDVSSSDPSGAENDGKTQIVIAEQVPTGHSLMYRNFGSGNVTVPMVGDEPVGYTQLPGSGLIIANNGDHIGIAMIDDTTGKIVQFGQTTAVVTAEPTPGTGTEAPTFIVTTGLPHGSGNEGMTKVIIVDQVPPGHNVVYYNFGRGDVPVPMVGDELPGYISLPDNGLITAKLGDRIGIALVDNMGKVVLFGQTTAVVGDESPTTPTIPGSSSTSPTLPSTPLPSNPAAAEGVEILVNGKAENAGKATTTVTQGTATTTIAVDPAKLQAKLDAEGERAVVTIPVKSTSDVIVGELNGQMVKNMEDRSATLVLKTDKASYTLPAEQINIDAISSQLGGQLKLEDIKVRISIAETSGTMAQVVKNAEDAGRFTIVAPALDFKVTGEYDGKTTEVTQFNEYIERRVALPDGIDPSKITTGVVVDPNGTVRHVPTKVEVVEGKYYAVINSLTNSTYSVVWHPVEFRDVASHWAKEVVNDMGSRMVIDGIGNGMFSPDTNITRAEFAAIIVRGLGLKLGEGTNPFSDIAVDAWYAGAVQTASTYDLITGFEDGTFRPNDKITREQAMTIIAKAMKLTGLADKLDKADSHSILAGFTDGSSAGNWAKESIAITIQASIVNGKDHGKLEPAAYVSRAEVAALIQRLLSKSDLI